MVNCLVAHREVGKQFVNTIYLLLLNVLCNSCKADYPKPAAGVLLAAPGKDFL